MQVWFHPTVGAYLKDIDIVAIFLLELFKVNTRKFFRPSHSLIVVIVESELSRRGVASTVEMSQHSTRAALLLVGRLVHPRTILSDDFA